MESEVEYGRTRDGLRAGLEVDWGSVGLQVFFFLQEVLGCADNSVLLLWAVPLLRRNWTPVGKQYRRRIPSGRHPPLQNRSWDPQGPPCKCVNPICLCTVAPYSTAHRGRPAEAGWLQFACMAARTNLNTKITQTLLKVCAVLRGFTPSCRTCLGPCRVLNLQEEGPSSRLPHLTTNGKQHATTARFFVCGTLIPASMHLICFWGVCLCALFLA